MLLLVGHDLDVIGIIAIILLIGIVKKNGIMIVDVALKLEREQGLAPEEAVVQASHQRLRPILMTTACALLGGRADDPGRAAPARSSASRSAGPSSAACWCRRC